MYKRQYFCRLHGAEDGVGMSGVIVVHGPGGSRGGSGGGSGGGAASNGDGGVGSVPEHPPTGIPTAAPLAAVLFGSALAVRAVLRRR